MNESDKLFDRWIESLRQSSSTGKVSEEQEKSLRSQFRMSPGELALAWQVDLRTVQKALVYSSEHKLIVEGQHYYRTKVGRIVLLPSGIDVVNDVLTSGAYRMRRNRC